MDVLKIDAQARETGKKAARQARRNGLVPCVLYGSQTEPVAFQVPQLSLRPLIYTDQTHRVSIEMNGDAWDCIMKAIDFHPVTDLPIHADFQVLQEGEKVTLTVPVQFIGTAVGQVDEGGDIQYVVTELEVSCLPKDIPSHIEVDVSALHVGDSLHVSDLDVPEVDFSAAPERTIVTVVPPRVEEEPEEEEGLLLAEGEEAEAVEGEEAEEADEEEEG